MSKIERSPFKTVIIGMRNDFVDNFRIVWNDLPDNATNICMKLKQLLATAIASRVEHLKRIASPWLPYNY